MIQIPSIEMMRAGREDREGPCALGRGSRIIATFNP
jgi:hypothetical protein